MLTVASCGGGGGGNPDTPTIATGQFKDSNASGITFVSGNQTGLTDANGTFTYEVGQTVTFSIGGVVIGTSSGKSVVSPIDLVANASSSTTEVQNIVRFLMMLDEDGDATNGISVSSAVRTIASTWTQVDFSAVDLATELTSIISDAASADGGTHTLPSAGAAQTHLESTLRCVYAGAYKGTYTGGDNGNFGVLVDASTGNILGVAYSVPLDQYLELSGRSPISFDQNTNFSSENTTANAVFNGQFGSVDSVSGTWSTPAFSGDFSAARIGGSSSAVHRYTGNYIGNDIGLFSFDLDGSNNITGISYSTLGGTSFDVTGSVSGTTLSVTASDGTSINGTLDTSTGSLSGTWTNTAKSLSGTFTGNGCKLN